MSTQASQKEKIFAAAHLSPTPQQLAWQQKELAAFFHLPVHYMHFGNRIRFPDYRTTPGFKNSRTDIWISNSATKS